MRNLKDCVLESMKDYFQLLCNLDTKDFEKVIKKVQSDKNIKPFIAKEINDLIEETVWMMCDVCDQHESNAEIVDVYGNDWLFSYIYDIMNKLDAGTDGEKLTISDSIAKNLIKVMKK